MLGARKTVLSHDKGEDLHFGSETVYFLKTTLASASSSSQALRDAVCPGRLLNVGRLPVPLLEFRILHRKTMMLKIFIFISC